MGRTRRAISGEFRVSSHQHRQNTSPTPSGNAASAPVLTARSPRARRRLRTEHIESRRGYDRPKLRLLMRSDLGFLVEVMGRYLNPSDQGERLRDLLGIVPSGYQTVNTRTKKAIHRRLRAAQVEELVAGYQTGSTVYQLAEKFRINRETVSKLLERQGVPRRNRPLSPVQIEQASSCTPLGCP
jgi:hypothetical protein